MDQATKTTLLATAFADVTKCIESLVDFGVVKTAGQAAMAETAAELGLPKEEGREVYGQSFPEFKQKLLAEMHRMAEAEIIQATHEADTECFEHELRLSVLANLHDKMTVTIGQLAGSPSPNIVDAEFIQPITDFTVKLRQIAQTSFDDLMKLVQMKHRLKLEHCFNGHHVSVATAKKLVELYEVK